MEWAAELVFIVSLGMQIFARRERIFYPFEQCLGIATIENDRLAISVVIVSGIILRDRDYYRGLSGQRITQPYLLLIHPQQSLHLKAFHCPMERSLRSPA